MVGVKAPDQIATPSTRNDLAFLVTVVGVSSVLAVAASFLPGEGLTNTASACQWSIVAESKDLF
jgi:hypothetical protein